MTLDSQQVTEEEALFGILAGGDPDEGLPDFLRLRLFFPMMYQWEVNNAIMLSMKNEEQSFGITL
jgi:hypothetical protein